MADSPKNSGAVPDALRQAAALTRSRAKRPRLGRVPCLIKTRSSRTP